jgi:hypothetical protein
LNGVDNYISSCGFGGRARMLTGSPAHHAARLNPQGMIGKAFKSLTPAETGGGLSFTGAVDLRRRLIIF